MLLIGHGTAVNSVRVQSEQTGSVQAIAGSLDGIIDTVAAKHPIAPYLATTKKAGSLVMLGVPAGGMQDLPVFSILSGGPAVPGCPAQW